MNLEENKLNEKIKELKNELNGVFNKLFREIDEKTDDKFEKLEKRLEITEKRAKPNCCEIIELIVTSDTRWMDASKKKDVALFLDISLYRGGIDSILCKDCDNKLTENRKRLNG